MTRFPERLYAVGAVCGLALTIYGLYDVSGFITDLTAGTTTTGDPFSSEVVERAKDAGRYWVLMAAWLRNLFFWLPAAGHGECRVTREAANENNIAARETMRESRPTA